MYEELEAVLDEYVRPLLHAHGGNVQVLSAEAGVVRFRLLGQCSGCPAADLTAEDLIENELTHRVPGVKRAVLEQAVDADLLDQARAILAQRNGGS